MKLIVGLGNPGLQYERTRHNAGFMVVDRLASRFAPGAAWRGRFNALTVEAPLPREVGGHPGTGGQARCTLLKPMTYMNRSGFAVGEAMRFYKLDPSEDLLVIVDECALPSGTIRLRAKGSDGGHNGLADVQRMLGTDQYARCRVGIDSRGRADQVSYVLGKFTDEQWQEVSPALDRACDAACVWANDGIDAAMNQFNQSAAGRADARGQEESGADDAGRSTEPSSN